MSLSGSDRVPAYLSWAAEYLEGCITTFKAFRMRFFLFGVGDSPPPLPLDTYKHFDMLCYSNIGVWNVETSNHFKRDENSFNLWLRLLPVTLELVGSSSASVSKIKN